MFNVWLLLASPLLNSSTASARDDNDTKNLPKVHLRSRTDVHCWLLLARMRNPFAMGIDLIAALLLSLTALLSLAPPICFSLPSLMDPEITDDDIETKS